MTKLYFIRHGKTKWNLEGRYQGAKGDSELLPSSFVEINELATFLSENSFKRIYTSPLRRARITGRTLQHELEVIQGYPTPISVESRLREFNLGLMEGMKFVDTERIYTHEVDAFRNHPDQYDPSDIHGESFQQLIERMRPVVQRIVERYPFKEDKIIIVSHGAALNALINSLLGIDLKDLRKRGGLANTSTTILETTDKGKSYTLIDWNDTSYLHKKLDASDLI